MKGRRDIVVLFFFFFQAEDGIRDKLVTGVQTYALPICRRARALVRPPGDRQERGTGLVAGHLPLPQARAEDLLGERAARRPWRKLRDPDRNHRLVRSEERRVGEEGEISVVAGSLKKKKK